MSSRILLFIPPILFLGLATLFYLGLGGDDELPSAHKGKAVPAVTVEPLMGQSLVMEDLTGEGQRLVNFWASWCGPCRAEHPVLEEIAASGIEVIGINYKDQPDNAAAFLEELGNPYAKLAADPSGRTGIDWGLYGVPETFLIDGGIVLVRHPGPITRRIFEEKFRPLIRP